MPRDPQFLLIFICYCGLTLVDRVMLHGKWVGLCRFYISRVAIYSDAKIILEAFSPIIIEGPLVLPDVSVGIIDASATRKFSIP